MTRKMKDSGVAWIGEIPEGWSVLPFYALLDKRSDAIADGPFGSDMKNEEYVAEGVPIIQLGSIRETGMDFSKTHYITPQKADILKRHNAYPQNIVIAKMMPAGKACEIPDTFDRYVISADVIRAYISDRCTRKFIVYALNSYATTQALFESQGSTRARVNISNVKHFKIVFPSSSTYVENILINLDTRCAKIDAIIAQTRETLDEYKKLKGSIITEAVTKGIRPGRTMKDSGIEWIGEIPEEWSVSKLKYVAAFEPSCDFAHLNEDAEVTYAPMDCVKNGYYIAQSAPLNKLSPTLTHFQENDIVMAKVTPCFENGNIAIMTGLTSGVGLGSSELFVFRATQIQNKYLFYWLQNSAFIEIAKSTMTGTGGLKRVSSQFVRNCYIHLPPLAEQHAIADYLDTRCAKIDALIAQKEQLIAELETYKKSLIYEYVTGKKEAPAL